MCEWDLESVLLCLRYGMWYDFLRVRVGVESV